MFFWRATTLTSSAVLATAALLTGAPATAGTATSSPPFSECPEIGSSPTCQILLVVNADRSVTVLGDPSVGPYDGGDDTIVGIRNDSTAPVAAVTVRGPSDIAGFDNDGLCAYPGAPATCSTAATGYEGPQTSLKTDPSDNSVVEVDFDSPGLAAGTSTYFSLEGALTSASLTAREGTIGDSVSPQLGPPDTLFTATYTCATAPSWSVLDASGTQVGNSIDFQHDLPIEVGPGHYSVSFQVPHEGDYTFVNQCPSNTTTNPVPFAVQVAAPHAALGDSYSSGEGATSFYPGTGFPDDHVDAGPGNHCHRSRTAWAFDVGSAHGYDTWLDACSGAVINDLLRYNRQNPNEVPQIDNLSATRTKLVTLTVGGNDVGFPDIITSCIYGPAAKGKMDCRDQKFNGRYSNDADVAHALDWLRKGRTSNACQELPGVGSDGKKEYICETAPSLHDLYLKIAGRVAPNARIIVAGYPQLFGSTFTNDVPEPFCQVGSYAALSFGIQQSDVEWLNEGALCLNNVIASEVRIAQKTLAAIGSKVKLSFASVDGQFSGHRLCDTDTSWFHAVMRVGQDPLQTSFHPTYDGQRAYARGVNAAW